MDELLGIAFTTFICIAGMVAVLFVIMIPIQQLETRAFVKEFQQTVDTVEVVRAKGEMPEADIMITANQILVKWQFYNNIPIIGLCITDQVDALQPIQ